MVDPVGSNNNSGQYLSVPRSIRGFWHRNQTLSPSSQNGNPQRNNGDQRGAHCERKDIKEIVVMTDKDAHDAECQEDAE